MRHHCGVALVSAVPAGRTFRALTRGAAARSTVCLTVASPAGVGPDDRGSPGGEGEHAGDQEMIAAAACGQRLGQAGGVPDPSNRASTLSWTEPSVAPRRHWHVRRYPAPCLARVLSPRAGRCGRSSGPAGAAGWGGWAAAAAPRRGAGHRMAHRPRATDQPGCRPARWRRPYPPPRPPMITRYPPQPPWNASPRHRDANGGCSR